MDEIFQAQNSKLLGVSIYLQVKLPIYIWSFSLQSKIISIILTKYFELCLVIYYHDTWHTCPACGDHQHLTPDNFEDYCFTGSITQTFDLNAYFHAKIAQTLQSRKNINWLSQKFIFNVQCQAPSLVHIPDQNIYSNYNLTLSKVLFLSIKYFVVKLE